MFTRTITAVLPAPAAGRAWIAWALLEAPDIEGQPGEWKAIEAGVDPAGGPIESRHAEHDPGWYMLQWHDDQRVSTFSEPVLLGGTHAGVRAPAARPRRGALG